MRVRQQHLVKPLARLLVPTPGAAPPRACTQRGRCCAYDLRRSQALVWRVGRRRLLLDAILVGAQVAQRLMCPLAVVPLQPGAYRTTGFGNAREVLLPDALLLEAPKEALDQPVLLGRVGRTVLLGQLEHVLGGTPDQRFCQLA